MTFITVDKIKKVREITGVGILHCRKVLEKTGGDIDQAVRELHTINMLRKDNTSNDNNALRYGGIDLIAGENRDVIAMVEVRCKTDFVSLNAEFRQYVKDLTLDTIKYKILNKEHFITTTNNKLFFLSRKFGENLVIKNVFYSGSLDGFYGFYLHTVNNISRIGVVVITDARNDIVSDNIAMQIAALNPLNLQSLLDQEYMLDDKFSVRLYLEKHNINVKSYVRFALGA
jgi:elongation factor Ts